MSLILEALKKSERERHGSEPDIAPLIAQPHHAGLSRTRRNRRQSVHLGLAIALLLVIALLLAWYIASTPVSAPAEAGAAAISKTDTRETQSPAVVSQVQRPESRQPDSPVQTLASVDAPSMLQQEVQVNEPALPLPEPQVETDNSESEERQESVIEDAQATELVVTSKVDTGKSVQPFSRLPSSTRAALKPLHLDVHVYDDYPDQRYVFINGRLFTEGDSVRNGIEIIAIVPTGVEMEFEGKRFLLTIND